MLKYREINEETGDVLKNFSIKNTSEYTVHSYKWGVMLDFNENHVVVSRDVYNELINALKDGKSVELTTYIREVNITLWMFNGFRLFSVRSELEVL